MKGARILLVLASAMILTACGTENPEQEAVVSGAINPGTRMQTEETKEGGRDSAGKKLTSVNSEPQSGTAEKQDVERKDNEEKQAAAASGAERETRVEKAEAGGTTEQGTSSDAKQKVKETGAASTHTHQWETVTKTIRHPAETEQHWVVDKKAWEETVTKEEPVYEEVLICVASCRGCGATFASEDVDSALNQCHSHIISEHGNACGYGTEQSYTETRRTGTTYRKETVVHPEEGHYETVETKAAWEETVVTGYRCITCGSTK